MIGKEHTFEHQLSTGETGFILYWHLIQKVYQQNYLFTVSKFSFVYESFLFIPITLYNGQNIATLLKTHFSAYYCMFENT